MLDRQIVRQVLPSLIHTHVPSNIRNFNYCVVDFSVGRNMLGIIVDPQPFEGKIVAYTDEMMVIKTGRKDFQVVDLKYVTDQPAISSKVFVTPYARRHFNGKRIDEPEEETRVLSDGTVYQAKTMVLGGKTTKLPIDKVKCYELAALIDQIEKLPAPDGLRKIVHILVDAGATEFSVVDPEPANIIATPPTITFKVDTQKFAGEVAIVYDRSLDLYVINLYQDGNLVKNVPDVYFEKLGEALVDLIDDGSWKKIEVSVLAHTRKVA